MKQNEQWGTSIVSAPHVLKAQRRLTAIAKRLLRKVHVEPYRAIVRRVLRPAWAPTLDQLLPLMETAARRVIHRKKLYGCLVAMERAKEIASVGWGGQRRYVMLGV